MIHKNKMAWIILIVAACMIIAIFTYKIALTHETFDATPTPAPAPPFHVIYYEMDSCEHCQKFKPEWDRFVAAAFVSTKPAITTEVIPSTDARVQAASITGFPTITIDGAMYSGARTSSALMKHIKGLPIPVPPSSD